MTTKRRRPAARGGALTHPRRLLPVAVRFVDDAVFARQGHFVVWVKGERPIEGYQRLPRAVEAEQHIALIAPGFHILRVKGERPVIGGQRLLVASQPTERGIPVAPRPRALRVQGQRAVEGHQRLLIAPKVPQGVATGEPGVDGARVKLERALEQRQRLGVPPLRIQRSATPDEVRHALGGEGSGGQRRLARERQLQRMQRMQRAHNSLRLRVRLIAWRLDALEVVQEQPLVLRAEVAARNGAKGDGQEDARAVAVGQLIGPQRLAPHPVGAKVALVRMTTKTGRLPNSRWITVMS